jgi:hypothetical protein
MISVNKSLGNQLVISLSKGLTLDFLIGGLLSGGGFERAVFSI